VFFDLSNKCNIRCRQCYFSYDSFYYGKAVFLKPDLFERIAAQVLPYAATVLLSAGTEPLTSPHFTDILKIVARYSPPEVLFLTNGLLLNPRIADAVIEHRVSAVHFSTDGATRKTYESIRRGGNFDTFRRNVAFLSERKRQRGSRLPKLVFNVTLMRSNVEELEAFVDLALGLGVSEIGGRHVAVFEGLGMEGESLVHDKLRANELFHALLEKAARSGIVVTNFPDYFHIDGRPWVPPAAMPLRAYDPPRPTRLPLPLVAADRPVPLLATGPRPPADRGLVRTETANDQHPFGFVDLPREQTVRAASPVHFGGWALDALGVAKVEFRRTPLPGDRSDAIGPDGLVPLGLAGFQNGSRPDVAALHPGLPQNYRAGWTFELTPPRQASADQVPLEVHVVAENHAGVRAELGVRTVLFGATQVASPYLYCPYAFKSVYINYNGDVYPYPDCHMPPLGSFKEDISFERVWTGAGLVDLRRRIVEQDPPNMCRRCTIFINRRVEDSEMFLERHVSGSSSLPVGRVDLPADGSECGGPELEFSGWAVGSVAVDRVEVTREPTDVLEATDADGRVPVG
jgi:MoaA/NifB/PqqE/SkfB family radical SAM enzyme